jgi:nicotinate-nucleotide adenylyltransferase
MRRVGGIGGTTKPDRAEGDVVRRLGVFGGTFDPLHIGHIAVAERTLREFDLDRVMFVPAGRPWQKSTYAEAEDRYLMTVLGTLHPSFCVSRIEIDRKGPTYTADTMASLRSFYGEGVQLLFVAGADAVLHLGSWEKLESLGRLAECVVAVTRSGFELSGLAPQPWWPRLRMMEMPPVQISSTQIRDRLRRGLEINGLVPPEVERYIHDHGLYRDGGAGLSTP